ncbi:MAG: thiamine phosphate synthase [Gemmatimonadota bacterium]
MTSLRRPLPRLHAVTDAATLALADFGVRAAAIAAAGPAVALHARDRTAGGAALAAAAARLVALARPPAALVIVSGRPDVAAATGAHGVQLAATDLAPRDARAIAGGWIGRSVHSESEAHAAADEGADYVLAGNVYETRSHPGRVGGGPALISACARAGLPVIAIGGVTLARLAELRDAGAWGVAAISALWHANDPARTTLAFLEPWLDAS